jgi:hypothetical protein
MVVPLYSADGPTIARDREKKKNLCIMHETVAGQRSGLISFAISKGKNCRTQPHIKSGTDFV